MLPEFCRCLGLDLLHWVPDLSFSPPHSAAKEKRRGILLIFTAYSEQTTTFGQMSEIIQWSKYAKVKSKVVDDKYTNSLH